MNKEQRDHLAATLGPPTAIVRDQKYAYPFYIKVPYLPVGTPLSDDEVLERLTRFVPVLFHPSEAPFILDAIRRERGIPAEAVALLPAPPPPAKEPHQDTGSGKTSKSNPTKSQVKDTAPGSTDFLRPLRIQLSRPDPFLTESETYEAADITSGSTKAEYKRRLIELGFIREHKIQRKKAFLSVWEPLEKAYVQLGLAKPQYASKGGYLHQFAAHRIKNYLTKQGYDVTVEYMLPDTGKAVDLWAKREAETIGWELMTSFPATKELENLRKDLSSSHKPDRIVVATVDSKQRRELEALIAGELWLASYRHVISLVLIGDCIE